MVNISVNIGPIDVLLSLLILLLGRHISLNDKVNIAWNEGLSTICSRPYPKTTLTWVSIPKDEVSV